MQQQNQNTDPAKDPELWKKAAKRASFKRHVMVYLIINAFLWILWYFNSKDHYSGGLPWPAWTTLGWGLGLAFNYIGLYRSSNESNVEKEYRKLKEKQ